MTQEELNTLRDTINQRLMDSISDIPDEVFGRFIFAAHFCHDDCDQVATFKISNMEDIEEQLAWLTLDAQFRDIPNKEDAASDDS